MNLINNKETNEEEKLGWDNQQPPSLMVESPKSIAQSQFEYLWVK